MSEEKTSVYVILDLGYDVAKPLIGIYSTKEKATEAASVWLKSVGCGGFDPTEFVYRVELDEEAPHPPNHCETP